MTDDLLRRSCHLGLSLAFLLLGAPGLAHGQPDASLGELVLRIKKEGCRKGTLALYDSAWKLTPHESQKRQIAARALDCATRLSEGPARETWAKRAGVTLEKPQPAARDTAGVAAGRTRVPGGAPAPGAKGAQPQIVESRQHAPEGSRPTPATLPEARPGVDARVTPDAAPSLRPSQQNVSQSLRAAEENTPRPGQELASGTRGGPSDARGPRPSGPAVPRDGQGAGTGSGQAAQLAEALAPLAQPAEAPEAPLVAAPPPGAALSAGAGSTPGPVLAPDRLAGNPPRLGDTAPVTIPERLPRWPIVGAFGLTVGGLAVAAAGWISSDVGEGRQEQATSGADIREANEQIDQGDSLMKWGLIGAGVAALTGTVYAIVRDSGPPPAAPPVQVSLLPPDPLSGRGTGLMVVLDLGNP